MNHAAPHCRQCERVEGRRVALEGGEGSFMACPECGLVDETATATQTFVSVSEDFGAILDENRQLQIKDDLRTSHIMIKFEQGVTDLINLYLGIPDPKTSVIGVPGDTIRSGVRQWFQRMCEDDMKRHKRVNPMHDASARKIKYYVAVSIKFALQESALVILDNRLEEKNIRRSYKKSLPGYVKGDEKLPNSTLMDIFNHTQRLSPNHFGHLDSFLYLQKIYRRYCKILHFDFTPLEYTLITLGSIVDHLRRLLALPFAERLKALRTRPVNTKGPREWTEDDFSFFENIDWSLVLPYGYKLFQAQECVRLWGNRCSPMVAIALTIWAMQAERKAVMPIQAAITSELTAPYGTKHWPASERYRDMRNMLLAWSTSIADAGLPFPIIPVPPKGSIGNGIGGYNSDIRRPIPEMDMAVAAAPIIALYWPRIVRARLRTRRDIMSFEDEVFLARKLFVISAAKHDKPGTKAKFSVWAIEAKKLLQTYRPLLRVRMSTNNASISTSSSRSMTSAPPSTRSSISPAPSVPLRILPSSTSTALSARPSQVTDFVPPPPEKTIEDMLATNEDSSDEDDVGSSDDDAIPAASAARGLGLENIGQTRQPERQAFSFTVGPSGFNAGIPSAQPPNSDCSAATSRTMDPNQFRRSTSSAPLARGSSVGSDVMLSSASEIDATTPRRRTDFNTIMVRAASTSSQATSSRTSLSPVPSSRSSNDSRATTPLTSISRIPDIRRSRCSSVATSSSALSAQSAVGVTLIQPRTTDEPHVGLLIRERDEYVQFRLAHYIDAGGIMKPQFEQFLWSWLKEQVKTGSMPSTITPGYLRSIGLNANPRAMDLGPWIQSKSGMWSPAESLLRAGIKPKEFPSQHIPHSILQLDLLLNHYHSDISRQLVQPVSDNDSSSQEINMLFSDHTGDEFERMFCTDAEAKKRKSAYEKAGYWFEGDDAQNPFSASQTKRASSQPPLAASHNGQSSSVGLYEAVNEDDDDDDEVSSRSPSRSMSATPFEGDEVAAEVQLARRDIHRIMSTIKRTKESKNSYELDGLVDAMREGEELDISEGGATFEAALLRDAIHVGGRLEDAYEAAEGEESDNEVAEETGGTGKRKRATGNGGQGVTKRQRKDDVSSTSTKKSTASRKRGKGKDGVESVSAEMEESAA